MKKATPYLRSPLFLAILIAGGSAFDVRAQDDDADYADNMVLEEIVVTARKRQETLQESPVAISALSADTLKEQGVQSTRDLQQSIPGLSFSEQGSKNPSIFIRGVGQREANTALDPGVGVYINGIYIARTDGQLLDTVDTESIQVLRGPQGTLFGKNNTGGAILVTTLQPHNEGVEGYASAKLGNFGRRDAKVGANIPLNEDSAALRFSLASVKRDGYLDNITTDTTFGDEDRIAGTARIYWQATDIFSVDTFLYMSKQNENGAGFSCLYQNDESNFATFLFPNEKGSNNSFKQACLNSERQVDGHNITLSGPSKFQMTSKIAALTLTWELDDIEIKSITAWSGQDDIVIEDDQDGTALSVLSNGTIGLRSSLERSAAAGFTGAGTFINDPGQTWNGLPRTAWSMPDDEKRRQISQELQVIGSAFDESLSYTAGVFYAKEDMDNTTFSQLIGLRGYSSYPTGPLNNMVPKLIGSQSDLDNETQAIFAQATYDLNDWLQLTLGGRYTIEKRQRNATIYEADCEQAAALTGTNDVLCGQGVALFGSPTDLADYLQGPPSYLPVRLAENGRLINDLYVEAGDPSSSNYDPDYALMYPDYDPNTPKFIPVYVPGGKLKKEKTFKKFTPTVTLAANLPEDALYAIGGDFINSMLIYGTYSRGFKGGGFEMRGLEMIQFDPEEVDNYELGVKIDAWDQRIRFNTALYQMKYKDIQIRVAEQGATLQDIFLFISNAGEATISGVESEFTILPMAGLTLTASFNWTDASYDEFTATEFQNRFDTTLNAWIPEKKELDRSKEDFGSTPKLTYNLAAMYDWYTDIGLFVPRLSVYFRDEVYTGIDGKTWEPEFRDRATLEDVTLWNFRLAYIPNENLNVSLFVDNLTDETYYQGGFSVVASAGATMATLGAPRTYGLEATYSF